MMGILLVLLMFGAPLPQLVIEWDGISVRNMVEVSGFEFRVEPGNELTPGSDWPYGFHTGEFVSGVAMSDVPVGLTGNIEIVSGRLRGAISEIYVTDVHGDEITVEVVDLRSFPRPVPK